ncbi:MAG: hypothetical protein LQ340_007879 [Diploschistes diacapsis]|nr:MAG: hypothetical protein LQ340_007879 [Diploschistes diacapsis]
MRDSSPSSSSSDSSSMFPSANAPTSPPLTLASNVPLTDLNPNTFFPPDSQSHEATIPSHLRASTTGTTDTDPYFNTDVPMADNPDPTSTSPALATATANSSAARAPSTIPAAKKSSIQPTPSVGADAKGGPIVVDTEEDESAPGYMWKNRMAMEEMAKARDQVLDREFTLREFGDPVLEQYRAEGGKGL